MIILLETSLIYKKKQFNLNLNLLFIILKVLKALILATMKTYRIQLTIAKK